MSQPPNPYYGPPRPPQYPHDDTQRAKTGLFRAGQVAVWVWVVFGILGVLLLLVPIACCGFCGLGGLIGGAANPSATP